MMKKYLLCALTLCFLAVSPDSVSAQAQRRSERWLTFYELQLPAGEVEVTHVVRDRNFYNTQIIIDTREQNYDLYVGQGATRWFYLQRPQRVRFQLENDPVIDTVWEAQNNPSPRPSSPGGSEMRYDYGTDEQGRRAPQVVFRFSYGGTGAGIVTGGTKVLAITGTVPSAPNNDQWARGMSAFAHSDNPEGWVRGSASIDRANGTISHTLQLETDSVAAGPKGKIIVKVYDAANRLLAHTEAEAGMGGKPPGRAVIRNFTGQTTIRRDVAQAAQRIDVAVQVTGSQTGLFGIDFGDVLNAIKLIMVIGGGGDEE